MQRMMPYKYKRSRKQIHANQLGQKSLYYCLMHASPSCNIVSVLGFMLDNKKTKDA